MEFNPTSYVILGMLGIEPMCGYEIKRFVDSSTRFFWAASYGQIYPELRRLADAGLIEGRPDANHPRRRIEFSLTPAGRSRLADWLDEAPAVQESRDESLLKVFFSGAAGEGGTRAALIAKRDQHRAIADELREISATGPADPGGGPATALRYGIALNDFIAEWCDRETREAG
jgi:DNA-binding PadR family transcriptional regulator